jgi:hypothetical protein
MAQREVEEEHGAPRRPDSIESPCTDDGDNGAGQMISCGVAEWRHLR